MAEGFLSRWSRLKTAGGDTPEPGHGGKDLAPPVPGGAGVATVPAAHGSGTTRQPGQGEASRTAPTMEDVMRLGPDSDYSAFVARGVDAAVRRQALRKLFSDPHFNIVDGLDVYMGDYTKSDPIPPAMLASLQHANAWLRTQLEEDGEDKDAQQAGAAPPQDHHKATAPQGAPAGEHDEH